MLSRVLFFAGIFTITGGFAAAQAHFNCVSGTGENATIIIPLSIEPKAGNVSLADGDEIAVFTPAGLCAGVVRWESWNTALTAWGNNTITSEVDGFRAGEEMHFRVYQKETGTVFTEVDVSFSMGGKSYAPDGLYRLASLTARSNGAAAPQPAMPENGATNIPTAVTLHWAYHGDNATFDVQVARNAEFTSNVGNYNAVADTLVHVDGLNHEREYFWRVRANVGGGKSGWSATWRFHTGARPPAAPSLQEPRDGATTVSRPVQLSWRAAGGATSYEVEIAVGSAFHENEVAARNAGTARSFTFQSAEGNRRYYWRVRALNAETPGEWSSVFSFTTDGAGLHPPELLSPDHQQTGVSLSPELTWRTIDEAEGYRLQISGDAEFSSSLTIDLPDGQTSYFISDMVEGVTLFWRVRSIAGSASSAWSPARQFTTATASVGPSSDKISFAATAAGHKRTAAVEISSDASSTTPVEVAVELPSTPFFVEQHPAALLAPGETSQIVVAFNPQKAGAYADTLRVKYTHHGLEKSFAVTVEGIGTRAVQPGEVIELLHPLDGSVDVNPGEVLQWSSIPGTTYHLQITRSPDFDRIVIDEELIDDTLYVPAGLRSFVEYSWRVKAFQGEWSAANRFRTKLGVPRVGGPTPESTVDPETVTFSWRRVGSAAQYDFRLASIRTGVFPELTERLADSSMTLRKMPPGEEFWWTVRAVSGSSLSDWSDAIHFSTASSLPGDDDGKATVSRITALYPNPTTGNVTLSYDMGASERFRLELWDATGRRVWVQDIPAPPAGRYTDRLDLNNLAAGPYWIRMVSDHDMSTVSLIVLD